MRLFRKKEKVEETKKIINCYYGSWAYYRYGPAQFKPHHINPHLCTHISYMYFGVGEKGEFRVLDEWLDLDSGLGVVAKIVSLKEENKKLKVLAVVGGCKETARSFSIMCEQFETRAKFIKNSKKFLKKYKFDGLDIHWEYPGDNGTRPYDKDNFVLLLQEIKARFLKRKFLLTITVGAHESIARESYNIPQISLHVDYINLMTFNYTTGHENVLSFNAPAWGPGNNNVFSSLRYWLDQGAAPEKLVLGLPFFGRTYRLFQGKNIAGEVCQSIGPPAPFTCESGLMSFNEFLHRYDEFRDWNYMWDNRYGAPYAFNNTIWVGYDDERSVYLKMEMVHNFNLGGVMIFTLDHDDFDGDGGIRFPLLKTVNHTLYNPY